MNPIVSIITPIYNKASVVNQTIESVLNQSYQNWELLLINDASLDNSKSIIKPFIDQDSRIKYFEFTKNKGAAEARNYGTKMAKGDYIAFLDADDLWHKNKLKIQLVKMTEETIDVCFGSYEMINAKSEPINIKVNALPILHYKKLLKANYIGNLTGIYNCKKLGKIYTKDLKKRQDWLLWIEALKRSTKPAKGITETIAYYRKIEGSLSANKYKLIQHNYNVYRKGLGFSIVKSCAYLLLFFYEHFFVKSKLVKTIS
ncbi:glycosyltransferase family 2 protein [Winogradskyella alexanderae]|uniref:Glycosyltransferase n=1 Tax=Winogradskyella alexanderae TaxID=2877123 RepID=A0ABS7XR31_9FLAO|nr:glycosyltransferase family 2 protein [Winogradskyella alexanderae]MCA0131306.1 glycosyltransferase [Winogradskyella alexanderae]